MTNTTDEDRDRLARIERLLEQQAAQALAQAEQNERLFMLLAAGQGKDIDALKKKSPVYLL